jgi:hypothetical protein
MAGIQACPGTTTEVELPFASKEEGASIAVQYARAGQCSRLIG